VVHGIVLRHRSAIRVESEPGTGTQFQIFLPCIEAQVVDQTSPSDALSVFREDPDRFDLVVTDYTMPTMTGLELARNMIKLREDIPIILLTGYNETVSEEEALHLGFEGFAYKPLDKNSLARLVRNTIDGDAPWNPWGTGPGMTPFTCLQMPAEAELRARGKSGKGLMEPGGDQLRRARR
jgi:CheY-like chemotaxis protein